MALFDAEGGSNISSADFAHAIVEEIDNPASSSPMSSTESAPAAMPAIRQPTFAGAFTPQSPPGLHELRYQLVQPGPLRQARHRGQAGVRDQGTQAPRCLPGPIHAP